jgi:sortase A
MHTPKIDRQPSSAPGPFVALPPDTRRVKPDPATGMAPPPARTRIPVEPVSLVTAPPPSPPTDVPPVALAPPPEPRDQPAVQVDPTLRMISQVLTVVAALVLGFLIELTLVGGLQHDRDQAQAFRELRVQLATGIAPVAALGEDGKLLLSGTPVAILEIPRLGLQQVILEGSSSRVLMSGVGHRRDTVLPGQAGTAVVLGRRGAYGGPFGGIDGLQRGDAIIVTTGQGKHTYTVLGVRRAGDPLPPALAVGQGRLNLVTADGPVFRPTDVLRVDANLTSPPQPGGVQIPSRALPDNEAVMAGDSGALLPLMLWGPLLLAAALGTVWLRYRAGKWQAWVIGLPVLALLGLTVIDTAAALLPNLL